MLLVICGESGDRRRAPTRRGVMTRTVVPVIDIARVLMIASRSSSPWRRARQTTSNRPATRDSALMAESTTNTPRR